MARTIGRKADDPRAPGPELDGQKQEDEHERNPQAFRLAAEDALVKVPGDEGHAGVADVDQLPVDPSDVAVQGVDQVRELRALQHPDHCLDLPFVLGVIDQPAHEVLAFEQEHEVGDLPAIIGDDFSAVDQLVHLRNQVGNGERVGGQVLRGDELLHPQHLFEHAADLSGPP